MKARADYKYFLDTVGDGTVIFLSATIMQRGSKLSDPQPCNLDYSDPDCIINLEFTRVDPSDPSSTSHGFNYRFTDPWSIGTDGTRTLTKVYGTRIVFQVSGVGARFDLMTLGVRFSRIAVLSKQQPLLLLLLLLAVVSSLLPFIVGIRISMVLVLVLTLSGISL